MDGAINRCRAGCTAKTLTQTGVGHFYVTTGGQFYVAITIDTGVWSD